MKGFSRFRSSLLPHEILFGVFLLVTWVHVLFGLGVTSVDSLVFTGLIVVNVVVLLLPLQGEGGWRWRVRLLFYPVAMNVAYLQMKTTIPRLHDGQLKDEFLQGLDELLVGGNLSLKLEAAAHPVLTELMNICYFLYLPYVLFSLVFYLSRDLDLLKRFYSGVFSIYGIGFLGYLFVPAVGPYVAMAGEFEVELDGLWLSAWNAQFIANASNGVDVFPSLHCAVSCFFVAFDWVHTRWRFYVYVLPCLGLWISTIYLRYHYFVDVICGFALCALCFALSRRVGRKPAEGESDETAAELR